MSLAKKKLARAVNLAIRGVVITAFTWPAAQQAASQTGVPQETESGVLTDEIIVTGHRLANQKAIDKKRNSEVISDILATDDLGKLPDNNLAEALGRVAGLTTFQDEGAGLYVGIRGLNQEFVNLTVDGQEFSSSARIWDDSLKGANMEAVPSSVVSSVEVFKSVTPDLDGDAIAGTVNLVTRSAFDIGETSFNASAAGGQYQEDVSTDDVGTSKKANLSFSTTFGSEDQFGLVLDAYYRNALRDNFKPHAFWGPVETASGNLVPREVGGYFYERDENSRGGTIKLEAQPSEQLYLSASAIYFDSDVQLGKNKHAIFNGGADNYDEAAGTISDTVGTIRNDVVDYGTKDSVTLKLGAEYDLDERNSFSFQASSSSSTSYQDDPRTDWRVKGLAGTYQDNGTYYTYQLDQASAALFADPSQYEFRGYRRWQEEGDKDVDTAKFDWTNQGESGWGVQAGLKWKETTFDYTASFIRLRNYTGTEDFNRFIAVDNWRFPDTSNPQTLLSDVKGIQSLVSQIGTNDFDRINRTTNGRDYKVSEEVFAGYGLAKYLGERYQVIFGVRYEATDFSSRTRLDQADDGDFVNRSGDYDDLLPSIAFTYDISEQLKFRPGVSQTLGRPDIRDLARGDSEPDPITGTFSRGNPNLKPRKADAYDLSLEYYFDEGASLLSIAWFRKELKDEIYTLSTAYDFTDENGLVIPSSFKQPVNAGDADIEGVEISFLKSSFDFLPAPLNGFGFQANATFNSGEIGLVDESGAVVRKADPEGLSDRLLSAALFYEGHGFSGRIAYQNTSGQYQGLSVDGNNDLRVDEYSQIDLQLAYHINDNFQIFAEVWNLTEESQRFRHSNWFEDVEYGSAYWLGINYKM